MHVMIKRSTQVKVVVVRDHYFFCLFCFLRLKGDTRNQESRAFKEAGLCVM